MLYLSGQLPLDASTMQLATGIEAQSEEIKSVRDQELHVSLGVPLPSLERHALHRITINERNCSSSRPCPEAINDHIRVNPGRCRSATHPRRLRSPEYRSDCGTHRSQGRLWEFFRLKPASFGAWRWSG